MVNKILLLGEVCNLFVFEGVIDFCVLQVVLIALADYVGARLLEFNDLTVA